MVQRNLKRWNEFEAVKLLQRTLGTTHAGVEVGIGDDAAVLRRSRAKLVWTVDVAVEGVHFERRLLTLEDVGFRSYNAAVSDLAAMGARPVAALSSLVLPRGFAPKDLAALAAGQAEAARQLACPVIGGNIARGSEISVTTTALGEAPRPLLRSGARAGDELWLIGEVGLAAAGLKLLATQRKLRSRAARRCIEHWRRPRALLDQGVQLVKYARAAIDISDGLGCDATRIAQASAVRVIVNAEAVGAVLAPELIEVARNLDVSALDLALSGGEDYALLAAGVTKKRPSFARPIGRFERGSGAKLELANGSYVELPSGFDHLSKQKQGRNQKLRPQRRQ